MPYDFSASPAPAPKPKTGTFDFKAGAATRQTGSFDFGTGKTINTGAPSKRGASSFLENVSDYIDVPLAGAEAGIADLGTAVFSGNPLKNLGYLATHEGRRMTQLRKDLAEGGPHQVAQNDVYFRQGSLQRVMADPNASAASKATANYFLHHPWAAGAADFVAEFANPSNVILGPIVGKVAQGASKVAHAVPYLGPALDAAGNWGRTLFDKYWPARKISPRAAQILRLSDASVRRITAQNRELAQSVYGNPGTFGSTTAEERFEIWRRAHGDEAMQPQELARQLPRTPGFTGARGSLTDDQLWSRANLLRAAFDAADEEQLSRGFAEPEQLRENYFKSLAYNPERYEQAQAAGFMRGEGGRTVRARFQNMNTKAKVFQSPTEILQANERMGGDLLAKDADPATAFIGHLNRVSGNVALDELIKRLTVEAPEVAQEISTQKLGFRVPEGTVTKQGYTREVGAGAASLAKGLQIAQRNARSAAVARAIEATAKDLSQKLGIDPAQARQQVSDIIRKRFPSESRLTGQMSELQRTGKVSARMAAAAPERLAQAQSQKMMQRGAELEAKLTDPDRMVAKQYRKLRDQFDRSLQPKYRERMMQTLNPTGMQILRGAPGLSGIERLKYTALAPELVSYFLEYGADKESANALAKVIDRFNALYRIGIVTNPIIHPFYNLLWGYFGNGGDIRRLVRIFRGGESALDREADSYGAHAHILPQTALGGSEPRVLMGPLSQAGGLAGKADWTISRLSNLNRAIVFDRLERNMATELWDDLWRKNAARGMDIEQAKREAGIAVRKTFGDYDNITKPERSLMTKAFFFYPWTKTVIPFWMKASVERPQMVVGPLRAIQTHNALAGDPNAAKDRPYTLFLGMDAQGQPIYKTIPLPQRILEDIGEVVTPRVGGEADIFGGIPERGAGLSRLEESHLTPVPGTISTGIEQMINPEPQEPGVTPAGHVMFNRAAPLPTQARQIAQYVGTQDVPFGSNIGNLATAFREALRGLPQAIPQALTGGFVYAQRTPLEQRALNKIMGQFVRRYDHAEKLPGVMRHRLQDAAYAAFRRQADAILNRAAPAVPAQQP